MNLTEIPYDPDGFEPVGEGEYRLVIRHGSKRVTQDMVPSRNTEVIAPCADDPHVLYRGTVHDGLFMLGGYIIKITGRQAV